MRAPRADAAGTQHLTLVPTQTGHLRLAHTRLQGSNKLQLATTQCGFPQSQHLLPRSLSTAALMTGTRCRHMAPTGCSPSGQGGAHEDPPDLSFLVGKTGVTTGLASEPPAHLPNMLTPQPPAALRRVWEQTLPFSEESAQGPMEGRHVGLTPARWQSSCGQRSTFVLPARPLPTLPVHPKREGGSPGGCVWGDRCAWKVLDQG